MIDYNNNDSTFYGTIDIEDKQIIPQFTSRPAGIQSDGWFRFDRAEAMAFQMVCNNLSSSVAWTLQISLDAVNWADAYDSAGALITGTLVDDVPTIEVLGASKGVYGRVYLTVTDETGNVDYIIRPGE